MDDNTIQILEKRLGRVHLKQRLGIETDRDRKIFGQGMNFFHPENWYSVHSFIRKTLKLLGLYGIGRKNALKILLKQNTLAIEGLPSQFDGFRILHISDLHLDMSPLMPDALCQAISQFDYDICVLTGDYRARTFGDYLPALAGLRKVREKMNGHVYAVLGNHDSIRMVPGLEEMGIQTLLNESVQIERDGAVIYLAGIDDPHYYRADNMEKASQNIPHDAVSILLSHSPEMYRHAAHADFNVMLCGHTHGGQICLPGGTALMMNANAPRSFCAGRWNYHKLAGYTSVGSGASIVDVRLNCPPEITLHQLRCE
jgi:predicted MPP superfamily phosphohydrolase